jgi:hypothetical protein
MALRIAVAAALTLATLLIPLSAHADTVVLGDGSELDGKIVEEVAGQYVVLETATGKQTIGWSSIKRVVVAPGATDRVALKNGATLDGTVLSRREGEFVVLRSGDQRLLAVPWADVQQVTLAQGHTLAPCPGGPPVAAPAAAHDEEAPRTGPLTQKRGTFFALATGVGIGTYSGASKGGGTKYTGSGFLSHSSLQGGFFVAPALALGAGGAFFYMPSPSGGPEGAASSSLDSAPGGFLGPAVRVYPGDLFHLSLAAGFGGFGASGFGGSGPAVSPAAGVDFYRQGQLRVGVDAELDALFLSSSGQSGTLIVGAALVSISYL